MAVAHNDIRDFLYAHFNRGELDTFCHDYFHEFFEDNEGTNIAKSDYVRRLIGYCERRESIPLLLAALQKERRESFLSKFQPVPIAPTRIQPRNTNQAFISYAHQDAKFAERLSEDLKKCGFATWLVANNIRPGETWMTAIDRGLKESGIFLSLLTPFATVSSWVRDETNAALGLEREGQIRVIPLMVRECKVNDLSIWLGNKQYISLADNYDFGFAQLVTAIGPNTQQPPTTAYRNTDEISIKSYQTAQKILESGVFRHRNGEYDKAIKEYTRAIELEPDYAEAFHNRGVAHHNKGDYGKAIADYTRAIELKPDFAAAFNRRGVSHHNKGDYSKAIADYTRAIELKPDFAAAQSNLKKARKDARKPAQTQLFDPPESPTTAV